MSQYTRPQNSHKGQLLTTEPVSETLCRYFYKRLCLCAIVCLCVFILVFLPPLRVFCE
jgi:hypothetical protein